MEKQFTALDRALKLLRAAVIGAGVLGLLMAAWFGLAGWAIYTGGDVRAWTTPAVMNACAAVGYGVLAGVSACCLCALAAFYHLCGRLRDGRAFCEENARAMARIAKLTAACGALLLGAAVFFEIVLLGGEMLPPIWILTLFMLAFFGVALLSWTLGLLVRRAAAIQQENDLTV